MLTLNHRGTETQRFLVKEQALRVSVPLWLLYKPFPAKV